MILRLLLTYIVFFVFENQHVPDDFVDVKKVIPDIEIDLRYFSTHNFVGDTIDGYQANICYLTAEAAMALYNVQKELKTSGYGLKVFDGYRPQQAVNHFVRWSRDLQDTRMKATYYPDIDKKSLFRQGYISSRSGHSRGSTVDLTLVYLSGYQMGQEVDMGTSWDFFSPRSGYASEVLSLQQRTNRMMLQQAMMAHGFRPYKEEWWHFTLRNEPFPTTYFDFPVK
ncbi:MAG: M15 family metallopeptidase [Cyclobacteriaceae bacterium]|nr:M15 family metallopeptidase [Cyclobacteriaceae bacterium]